MSKQPALTARPRSSIGELIRTVVYALLIALVFRTLAFQPFSIPSGSMKPTLLQGDYLFVSKYAYGYSRHSMPYSPALFAGRLFGSEPERGDIVVFKLPRDGRTDYIKRLVGLPGDRIQLRRGILHVNDQPVERVPEEEFREVRSPGASIRCKRTRQSNEAGTSGPPATLCLNEQWRETLADGRSYLTLNSNDDSRSRSDNTGVFEVPPGHYFFLGDNRDNSVDSRFTGGVGFVPFENLVGRAEIIFLSSAGSAFAIWNWRLDRFFVRLR